MFVNANYTVLFSRSSVFVHTWRFGSEFYERNIIDDDEVDNDDADDDVYNDGNER